MRTKISMSKKIINFLLTTALLLSVNVASAQFTKSLSSKNNISCNGLSDGGFTLSVTGGTSPYEYSLTGGSPFQTSSTFTGLPATSYIVTIKDNVGAVDTMLVTLTEPAELKLGVLSKTNVTCNGLSDGTISLSVTGGTSTYSYKVGTASYQASNSFSNLSQGSYVFTVIDFNFCIDTIQSTIIEPTLLKLQLNSSNVSCFGAQNGKIEALTSGGYRSYQYKLGANNYVNDSVFNNLNVGIYTITTKDINECTTSKSVVISQPTALSVSSTAITNVDCKANTTGSVAVAGSGGTTPYTYNIDGGSYSSANTFGSLAAGSYTIGVKDANGCTSSVSITITEPAILNLSATVTNPVCFNDKTGKITLSVTGGTSTYDYRVDTTWSNPTSGFVTTNVFSNLFEGRYAAQVKDANGCLDTVQVLVKHIDLVKPIPVPFKKLTVYLGATGTVFVSANMADSASTDNCTLASRSITKTAFNCSNVGFNIVNFKVVDINGNRDSINFIVNVLDTTKPH